MSWNSSTTIRNATVPPGCPRRRGPSWSGTGRSPGHPGEKAKNGQHVIHPSAVVVGGQPGDLVEGEVLGLGAGGELLQAQVDGVGPVVKGGVGRLRPARRGQQFRR